MPLATYTKQPADVQDYDIDFATEYLAGLGDTAPGPTGLLVVAETGISIQTTTLSAGRAKVWVAGGTTGKAYKITVTLTTTGGRIKQVEIVIKVKET